MEANPGYIMVWSRVSVVEVVSEMCFKFKYTLRAEPTRFAK